MWNNPGLLILFLFSDGVAARLWSDDGSSSFEDEWDDVRHRKDQRSGHRRQHHDYPLREREDDLEERLLIDLLADRLLRQGDRRHHHHHRHGDDRSESEEDLPPERDSDLEPVTDPTTEDPPEMTTVDLPDPVTEDPPDPVTEDPPPTGRPSTSTHRKTTHIPTTKNNPATYSMAPFPGSKSTKHNSSILSTTFTPPGTTATAPTPTQPQTTMDIPQEAIEPPQRSIQQHFGLQHTSITFNNDYCHFFIHFFTEDIFRSSNCYFLCKPSCYNAQAQIYYCFDSPQPHYSGSSVLGTAQDPPNNEQDPIELPEIDTKCRGIKAFHAQWNPLTSWTMWNRALLVFTLLIVDEVAFSWPFFDRPFPWGGYWDDWWDGWWGHERHHGGHHGRHSGEFEHHRHRPPHHRCNQTTHAPNGTTTIVANHTTPIPPTNATQVVVTNATTPLGTPNGTTPAATTPHA
ncbi:hypothetical protein QR680_013795 [Steinernema hermaphroditum]|uniref:Uncharacterized protein n=1 Tax=Steinernema hermaphroditum TaxID=289476 RepID=A0AA39I9B0_9BILA|nr:hypothetical protein QR680_013795 [Steinernema hermaphroditum]